MKPLSYPKDAWRWNMFDNSQVITDAERELARERAHEREVREAQLIWARIQQIEQERDRVRGHKV